MARYKTSQTSKLSDYFKFSRSQRRAMLLMVVVTGVASLLIQWNSWPAGQETETAFIATGKLENLLLKDTALGYLPHGFDNGAPIKRKTRKPFEPSSIVGKPDFFDPNTADAETLAALGLREKAIHNIIHYREKGGRFRKPEDLAKLYSLKPEEVQKLMPYVRIADLPARELARESVMPEALKVGSPMPARANPIPVSINVNRSDSIEWQLLPGIGAKRASAILRFREKLGGFVSIEQVGETFGLPDSVFRKIKASLAWEPGQVEQLSLNHAPEAELKAHPYIGWQWAKLIVAYRNQHGPYRSVDDLMKIHIVKQEWLEKVRPYLIAD